MRVSVRAHGQGEESGGSPTLRGELTSSESSRNGGGTRELRRAISASWRRDRKRGERGNGAGVGGYIVEQTAVAIAALMVRNRREKSTVASK